MHIKSRTFKYVQKWNENLYLNVFNTDNQNGYINITLGDVYSESLIPYYTFKNELKTSRDLQSFLTKYIDINEDRKMLLILGQPGIGKNVFLTWLSNSFAYNIHKILVYQFADDLKKIDWKHISNSYDLIYKILKELNLSFEMLEGKVLILDGLDDVVVGNEKVKILNQLYQGIMNESVLYKFSIIITCRRNEIHGLDKVDCDYIKLQLWDKEQIQNFCIIYQKKIKNNTMQMNIDNLINNEMFLEEEILSSPLILYIILALNIAINERTSIIDVYDQLFSLEFGFNDWYIKNYYKSIDKLNTIKKQIYQILKEIAFWMFENNSKVGCIPKKKYKKICNIVLQEQNNRDVEQSMVDEYLKLVKYVEGIETEEIYFIHSSIYEYFLSQYIFTSMNKVINIPKELAGVFGKILKGNELSIGIKRFLKLKIINSELYKKFDEVNKSFQGMLQNGMTFYTGQCFKNVIRCEKNVFANMLEIIHFWEKNYYKFDDSICNYLKFDISALNLSKVDLSGADLFRAYLFMANLEGANLMNANLTYAILFFAELNEADLRFANLQEIDLYATDLEGVKLDDVYLRNSKIAERQIRYLEKKCDLNDVMIRNEKTGNFVSYEEYCKRKKESSTKLD